MRSHCKTCGEITPHEVCEATRLRRRDMFAAAALTGLLAAMTEEETDNPSNLFAWAPEKAWKIADAMLEADGWEDGGAS